MRPSPAQRREERARALLSHGGLPAVPPDLVTDAITDGRRVLLRRRLLRATIWTLLTTALLALAIWALATRAWEPPPSDVTPPATDWWS